MGTKESKSEFKRVAILAHSRQAQAGQEAEQVAEFFREHGVEAHHGDLTDEKIISALQAGDFDLVVTLGGDGGVLRAGHLCAEKDIPLLGINMGRFGFLIEVEPEDWRELLPRLFTGDYWFERRMLLNVQLQRGGKVIESSEALNEAMIGRGRVVRPVHLLASLDGEALTTYVADGLIIATATGSTAYALAAGGPILPPQLRNILLLPVAPHLSVDRAIVLSEGASIRAELKSGEEPVLSIDGRHTIDLEQGDIIDVRASDHSVRFLRFQEPGYFYKRLLTIMDNNPATGKENQA
ncbi:MAG: NAD(+)/NADH kinase [Chloroflexi bacterium]|nr:NAD(+)/NADH kinase [Chloroflexota bacterium]